MKASGITKCSNKKWSASFSGDPNVAGPSAIRPARSVIQVNENIHFLVNNNDFPTLVPNEKSIELSRRTYSKKNPIAARALGDQTPPSFPMHLPVKSATPVNQDGALQKKRKSRNDLPDPNPSKVPRKNFQSKSSNGPMNNCSPAKIARNGGRPVPSSDSDSDVEIVAVKLFQPVTVQVSKVSSHKTDISRSLMKKTPSSSSQNGKKKSKFFSSEVNHSEILMNEADVAPTDLFSDGRSSAASGNSLRWLSANGTIAMPSGGAFGSATTTTSSSEGVPSTAPKSGFQQTLHLPELKASSSSSSSHQQEKASTKKSRELENLYKNLDEISWTHEKSFKNLLRNPDYIRHSERGAALATGGGKNLRKKKKPDGKSPTTKKAATVLAASKKNRMARLNNKTKGAARKTTSPLPNSIKTKKTMKNGGLKDKSLKLKVEDDESDVFYMLNPDVLKVKTTTAPTTKNGKPTKPATKTKSDKPKGKQQPDGGAPLPKIKTESSASSSKAKSNLKLKPDGLKAKAVFSPDVKKLKSYVPIKKQVDSPPSTSGLQQQRSGGGSTSATKSAPSSSRPYNGKGGNGPDVLRKFENGGGPRRFPNDLQMLRGYIDRNEDVYSAFQNASKLRVRLQPLEHTDLWTTEFYEEFRKHFLDQCLRKALENRDTDSSNIMYQELLESFMSSQSGGATRGGGGARVLKQQRRQQQRGEEEAALRSSVRQSEGAFRYKEIVVKKHPNYMQVVLVPNDSKQNSLTVEAMKELKEAFLLAKKDPNCRAVLINSSGPYFCTGIDLAPLVGNNKRQAAEDISNSVRDLVMTLGMFTKPVIAAVNGAALGFGVSLLTYCDVVLASDKATFCLPATKIGYIPEGGITYTLPQVVGSAVASEMFLQGRRITAEQACRFGLVSEVIWPHRLMNEVIPRLETIISQPLQAMEATKTMVRCHLWDKLKGHVDRERRLLCEHWLAAPCQSNIKTLLETGWLLD